MRTRRRLPWIIFAICILAVLEGLGWVTWHALRLERREREAQAGTQFQQSIRLALWRMESEITPIIAAEAARPYFHYISFYPADRAYTKMFQQVLPGELRVPSPLLESSSRYVRLHYQIDPDGAVTSPQAPTGNMRDLAEAQYLDSEFIVLAGQMLEEVASMVHPGGVQVSGRAGGQYFEQADRKLQQVSEPPAEQQGKQVWQIEDSAEYKAREKAAQTAQTSNIPEPQQRRKSQAETPRTETGAGDTRSQAASNKELALKKDSARLAPESLPVPPAAPRPAEPAPDRAAAPISPAAPIDRLAAGDAAKPASPEPAQPLLKNYQAAGPATELNRVEQGSFAPRWYRSPKSGEDELILERSVTIDGRETRQGVWIDWPQLREQLKSSIEDLLPAATLCPATDTSEAGQRLAAIPVRLLPGPMPAPAAASISPTHVTLLVTWIAVLGAIGAIGVVLQKAFELSERRGRFVSAVTHELRTPLTTFCLYTEMLSEGMVKDEAVSRQYLGTLRSESGRLARIVQNVLDYAGIGGVSRRTAQPSQPVAASEVMERLRPSLQACAQRAGMSLDFRTENLAGTLLRVDPQTVERILLNLVDNSGKYAAEASDRTIHVSARTVETTRSRSKTSFEVTVRDHGPGVPKSERRKIFHAFHRASRDAQGSKSGLGLGLALALELTRELGGNLTLNPAISDGAEFRLSLPTHTEQNA